jgi:mannosyltransferase
VTGRTALAPHPTSIDRTRSLGQTLSPGRVKSAGPAGWRRALHGDRGRPAWPLIVAPAVTLVVMLWGIAAPAYWGDEADTVSAVSRSLPQLLLMLRHVDAVHGLYYLSLWPVVRVLGPGEFATRLPSALAMAAAALGIAAIARRLVSARAALWAGLLFAATPMISAQGHDGRPYGVVTASAVLASYLLIRAVDSRRRGWFAAYGASLVLLGYLELFGLLLILAHGVTLAGLRWRGTARTELHDDLLPDGPGGLAGTRDGALAARRPQAAEVPGGAGGTLPRAASRPGAISAMLVVRRWLVTVAAAVIAIVPLVLYGWQQRAQIAWIARPDWHDVLSAMTSLAGGPTALAVVTGLLAMLGIVGATPAPSGRSGLPWRPVLAGLSPRPVLAGLLWRAALAGLLWRPGLGRGPGAARTSHSLTWLALPWLVLPPAMLLAASEIKPAYNFRYLVFCLPAMALLAGAGLAVLAGGNRALPGGYPQNPDGPEQPHAHKAPMTPSPGPRPPRAFDGPGIQRRVRRWAAPSAVLGLIVALVAPTQLSIRVPGTGMREVSQFLAARERPGDAVIYPGSGVPPWYLAYPDGLGRLRDIWMAESGPATGRLYGIRVQVPVLLQRERGVCRIWAVEMTPPWPDPAPDLAPGFQLADKWQPQPGVWLWLYQRPGCTPAPGTGR